MWCKIWKYFPITAETKANLKTVLSELNYEEVINIFQHVLVYSFGIYDYLKENGVDTSLNYLSLISMANFRIFQ